MNKLKNKIGVWTVAAGAFCFPFVAKATELYSPVSKEMDVPTMIGRVLSVVIGVIGAIALAVFIYGGFLWMTSAGNGKKVEEGKSAMVWAVLGLVIIFSARAILKFVLDGLIGNK
ncbi:MAG TPA: TrbC/VirB2 family protein [bacterium]|nr:TrbC/VirB2 family protein [bacterium]